MLLSTLDVSAFDKEQYCLFTAFTKDGKRISQEECEMLLLCGGRGKGRIEIDAATNNKLLENSL